MSEIGPLVNLFRDPAEFSVRLSRRDRALVLSWAAETEAPHILWVRGVTLKIGWPPLHWVSGFTDRNEVSDD